MNLTTASLLVAGTLVFGALFFAAANQDGGDPRPTNENLTAENGTQIITIAAKGGYTPRASVAKAGLATELSIKTNNTFDCSSALVIPAVGYRQNLPVTGDTRVSVPPQQPGTTLRGLCTMGMYSFTVEFR